MLQSEMHSIARQKKMLGQKMKHSVLTSLFLGLSGKGSGTTWTHRRQIEQQAQGK